MEPRRSSAAGSSRINVFSPSTYTTPLTSNVLGKRTTSGAGLETSRASSSRPRTVRSPPAMSTTSLQRQILDLQAKSSEDESRLEELGVENERLRGERVILLEGETQEKESGKKHRLEWGDERVRLTQQLRELRNANNALRNAHEQLTSEHTKVSNEYNLLLVDSKAEITTLESHLKVKQEQVDQLKGFQRRSENLSIQLEEEKRKADEGRQGREDEKGDRKGDEVMRAELRRQAGHLTTLQEKCRSYENDLHDLRQFKKEADAHDRTRKEVERTLKEQIHTLQDQLERARRDMDSLTTSFPSTASPDASELQHRLQALSVLHNEATTDIATKDTEIRSLHLRLSELAQSSREAIKEWTTRVNEAERELRWAKEGRVSAERREALTRKELEAMEAGSRQSGSMPGGMGSMGDQSSKIRQLEELVATYKSELEGISRDSKEVEEKLTQGAGLVKQTELDEAVAKAEALSTEISALQETISALTSANTTLDAEVNDLMRRVASGEYNPEKERCLELKANPAAKIHAVRNAQLEALKAENEALLDRLRAVGAQSGPSGDGLIPAESLERLRKEKEDMEEAHAKRLMRLKEIFGSKSKEFLETVYSLLGWRIRFDESGLDVRLTSMYAPKGKMGLTLKFSSQEGHFGTMQMTGAMSKGLEDTRHFWIQERQSVPGFLAQVTTEMFEKTTMGRVAGYVGLE